MSPVAIDQPSMFELVRVRVVAGGFVGLIVALYRPDSVAVKQTLFDNMTAFLDQVANYKVPIYVTGDLTSVLTDPTTHTPSTSV
jgi:hypothetical protein